MSAQRRMLALAAEFGWATTHAAIEAVLDGAERQARAVIATWKDGVYRGEAFLDDDGHGYTDIHVRATVTKRGSDLTIDLSDSHEQVVGFVNSSYPNMRSAVVVALAYLIDPHTPKNDGAFRPLEVIAKPGTVVWANEGAPVTLCTNHCWQEIIEAIIKALAPACPDRAMAGWGRRFRIAIQGRDPRTQKPFIWHMFQARPGGGASPVGDGWPAGGEWQAAGGIKFGSLEVTEVRFPLFFRQPRVPPGVRRRRAVSRRPRGRAGDGGGDRRAGARQHRRRRREVRRLRDLGRQGRAAASLRAALRRAAAARAEDQRGRHRDPTWRCVSDRVQAAAAAGAIPRGATRRRGSRTRSMVSSTHLLPLRRGAGEGASSRHIAMLKIGIDVGGTFTDLVAVDDNGHSTLAKVASTPEDPSVGVMDGLDRLAELLRLPRADLLAQTERIVHGTTVATNALLEHKGAKVGLLTTEGHRDIIEMREGLKDDRYNLRMPPPQQLVPRALRLGVT